MKIGIIKERKSPPDRRVVFSPHQLKNIENTYKALQFVVEPSDIRIFSDESYRNHGILVKEDLSDCDVLLGVKEVPIDALIPNKSYFFFSHTIKKQDYNRKLLQAILQKNINLHDHEVITDSKGNRLIGFGRYAGLVGAYNGLRLLGKMHQSFELPKVENLPDLNAVLVELDAITIPNIKIILTGSGKVARGAREILEHLKIKEVSVEDYLSKMYQEPVYTIAKVMDYNKRKDGSAGDVKRFFKDPTPYESDFMKFAKVSDLFIAGHFYGDNAPFLFTRQDAKHPDFNIKIVADISCDIDGPVASTIRPSTIDNPFYGYDPVNEKEVDFRNENAIGVMAVDNLPCELPKDASEGFGDMFAKHVIPAFFNHDKDCILERSLITHEGKLTKRFSYLQDFVEDKS
ncbi:NAD(P)-dependent oxidoreductase [Mesohalobacter halotolerans]|uniref:Saccharopine dehydrogenase [NAD(+), L-lysine-forming] n=1 Tax=Mesohalobacter halotolerans TaxID=1883405 RepID=A0A4U5TPI0_9FLAO|nr:NAD(P)-dependent oxidoreductase [Mesohalobacter halotolerans]TKS55611.1 alanine dehydrogenase [Mesohalobacter halotolerans]